MKNKLLNLLGVVLCGAVMLTAPIGCETFKTVYNAGTLTLPEATADQLIVAAEKGAEIGLDTFNTFIHLEKDHRAAYQQISVEIYNLSVWLRKRVQDPTDIGQGDPPIHYIPRGEALLKSVRKATKEFKTNRTPANEANLRTAWAALKSVINDVKAKTALATGGTQ